MLSRQNNHTPINGSHGFSMLEVLITVFILSLGLLGLAGMITMGLKSNSTASFRSIAVHQTQDIADRIRANLAGVRDNSYLGLDPAVAPGTDCMTDVCTAAEMATYDFAQWNNANGNLLPNGRGRIDGNLVNGLINGYVITMMWTEKDRNQVGRACPDGESVDTQCFQTVILP